MRIIVVGNMLLETASTLDNRKLLLVFAVVTAIILIDYEFGNIADFIPEIISSRPHFSGIYGSFNVFDICWTLFVCCDTISGLDFTKNN